MCCSNLSALSDIEKESGDIRFSNTTADSCLAMRPRIFFRKSDFAFRHRLGYRDIAAKRDSDCGELCVVHLERFHPERWAIALAGGPGLEDAN